LFYCSIVLLFYCSIVLLFYCSIVLLFYCSIVLLFYCSIVLLFFCSIVLLFFGSFHEIKIRYLLKNGRKIININNVGVNCKLFSVRSSQKINSTWMQYTYIHIFVSHYMIYYPSHTLIFH